MNTTFEQYKNLFDQAPCGIGLFSAVDGQRAFYLNKTYYDLIGYSKEEYETISDDPITALVYQDDVLRVQKLFDQSTSEPLEAEYRIINKKGELVWIKLNVSTMEADGEAFAFASFVDVSKEKKLNDQLSLIAGNIEYSISILMLDADGRLYLEYANDEFYKLTGYSSTEYTGDVMAYARRGVSDDVFNSMRPLIEKALQTGQAQMIEYPLVRANGSVIWLRRQFSAIPTEKPGSYRLLSITADITTRHHAEEMLKNIINYIPAGIVVYHIQKDSITIQEANPSVCQIMGIDRDSAIGSKDNSFLKYTHPDDLKNIRRIADEFFIPGTCLHYEYRHFNKKKNAYIWLSADGRSMAQPDGSVLVYISYVDITAQKNAEAEIALRDDALRIADKSLSAGTIINSLGLNAPMLYVSDNFQNFLGYTKSELLEMFKHQYADIIYPEDYERVIALNNRYASERPATYEMQFRFVRKDGSVFWTLEKGTFIEDFRGSPAYLSVFIDITVQKRAEQTLFERNAMFDILLENSNLSMWTYDIATKTAKLISSKRHKRPISYEGTEQYPESVIGMGIVQQSSIEDAKNLIKRVESGEAVVSSDIWYSPVDAEPWCDKLTYVNIKDSAGTIIRTVGIAEDVTDQRLAQRKFEEELNYQQTFQSENLLTKVRANMTQNILESYESAENVGVCHAMMPYDASVAAVSKTGYGADDRTLVRRMMNAEKIMNDFECGQPSASFEYRRKTNDGRIVWVRVTIKTYLDTLSGDIKTFMYSVNINKEKTDEMIIQAVASTEHDMIMLINLKTDEYSIYAHNIGSDYAPQKNGTNFIKTMETVCKRGLLGQDAERAIHDLNPSVIKENLKKTRVFSGAYSMQTPKGEIEYKKIQYFWLDEDQELVIMTRGDITELTKQQQRQQELLRSALMQAEQASNAKTDFLSKMSHEIRTPMNAIIGMNTLAVQNAGNPEAVNDCLSKVGISARYLLTLINDILDMSRIESGKMTLRNDKIPFVEFINGINNIIYEQTTEKNISYDSIIMGFVAETYLGDAMKLQQILVNLLGNAVKFTPPGGKVQLIISQERTENNKAYMKFTVNDTGCGISEEFQKVMFEPFEQEHSGTTSTYGGTGLGLAISKNLVNLMSGSITVSSIVGVGSEFIVNVPLGIVEDGHLANQTYPISFGKMKALVVDDEILICEQVKATLVEIGMEAEWVDSGYKAVERVKEKWNAKKYYDIILVDWKMPDMDGIETAREIREIVGPDVTIIIITAYEWAGIEQAAKAAGVNLLITKPLFKSSLVSAFERVFSSKTTNVEPVKTDYDFTGKRVLLVEDHLLNVEVAKRLLESKHMAVEVAENGLAAIEAYAKTPLGYYDLILMDIRMPVMDGLTATKSIRQMKKATARTIPIIAMSANAFDDDMEKSQQAGMNAHLSKPIEPDALYETISHFLK